MACMGPYMVLGYGCQERSTRGHIGGTCQQKLSDCGPDPLETVLMDDRLGKKYLFF